MIRVWTRQDKRILSVIEREGIYYCQPQYIESKMENFSNYYKQLYQWYVARAEKIVPRPNPNIKYPIWVSVDEEMQLQPVDGSIILELEIDEKNLIVTDSEKWGYVVNFLYLPLNQEDLKAHDDELKRYGIGNESALIMGDKGNFYPLLKQKIQKSWNRLFENYTLSNVRQGTIWAIHKKDIVRVIGGGDSHE